MSAMTPTPPQTPSLSEDDIDALQRLLDQVPAPLEPLDISALDGYLCGVLLQPRPVPRERWLPGVTDLDCSGTTDAGDLAVLLGAWG